MDLTLVSDNIVYIFSFSIGIYLVFYILYRKIIVSYADPLNISLIILSCYTAGLIFANFISNNYSDSFYKFISLLSIYMIVGAIISNIKLRKGNNTSFNISINKKIQIYFSLFLLLILLLNIVVNYIFGVIPILKGIAGRSEMSQMPVPSLALLSYFIGNIVLLLGVMSDHNSVKIINKICLFFFIFMNFLSGGKSALFLLLIILFNYYYILILKLRSNRDAIKLTKKIIKIKKIIIFAMTAIVLFSPIYLRLIKFGENTTESVVLLFKRIFAGFDGMIYIILNGIDFESFNNLKLYELYLYPIIKKLFYIPEFQSAGEYIIYLLTKNYNFTKSGLNPNSNFILELLFSHSYIFSIIVILIASYGFYSYRAKLLMTDKLRLFHIILFNFFIFSPFGMLIDGAYFIINLYLILSLYFIFNTLINMMVIVKSAKLNYIFY
jgi:hypothetical protein